MGTELITFNKDELTLIKSTIANKTSDNQFKLFIQACKQTGLNPFAKQIYAVVRGQDMTIQTGIDGYRLLAERSGKYAGQLGPEWCDESGEWKDYWISNKAPVAARVGVLRRDFANPVWGMARLASYEQPSSPLWRKMPEVMLAKCAESLALRRAFPAELSGLYTKEEMDQADSPMPQVNITPDVTPVNDAEVIEGEAVDASENFRPSPVPRFSPSQHSQPTTGNRPVPHSRAVARPIEPTVATEQQLSSIGKLCTHLGKPAPDENPNLSFADASKMLQQLTAEYRESKQQNKAS